MITILRETMQSFLTFLERVGLLVRFAHRLAAILPLGLALDLQGRLIVADSLNNQVKLIPAAAL